MGWGFGGGGASAPAFQAFEFPLGPPSGGDDTATIRTAIEKAVAYFTSGKGTYARILGAGTYLVNGPLITGAPYYGNSQLPIDLIAGTGAKFVLEWRALDGAAFAAEWPYQFQVPYQTSNFTLLSNGQFGSQAAQAASIGANGNPCVIGVPAQPAGYGTSAENFSNICVVFNGLRVLTPYSVNGWNYCGADLSGAAQSAFMDTSFDVTTSYAQTWHNSGNIGNLAGGASKAFLLPANGNNDMVLLRNVSVGGGYTWGPWLTEHSVAQGLRSTYCWTGIAAIGDYFGSSGATHAVSIDQLSVEGSTNCIQIIGEGGGGIGPFLNIGQLDTEENPPTITDNTSGAGLAAARGNITFTGEYTPGSISLSSFPCGIRIIDGQIPPGAQTSPAMPGSGIALRNPFWRDAVVTITGGVVSGIAVDGEAAGFTATGLTVIVPTGKTITVFYSVAPSWAWWAL